MNMEKYKLIKKISYYDRTNTPEEFKELKEQSDLEGKEKERLAITNPIRPTLGIKPEKFFIEGLIEQLTQRNKYIIQALIRYEEAGNKELPENWLKEYNENIKLKNILYNRFN
jgi:hypothetical protein